MKNIFSFFAKTFNTDAQLHKKFKTMFCFNKSNFLEPPKKKVIYKEIDTYIIFPFLISNQINALIIGMYVDI